MKSKIILVGLLITLGFLIAGDLPQRKHRDTSEGHIQEIYSKVLAQTGQLQDAIPLVISNSMTVNAYDDGEQIVLYRGLINQTKNDDEIALILGHELAHKMLAHLVGYKYFYSTADMGAETEANADKMGAVYMMKAGYDVCLARDIWKRFKNVEGNAQGENHPTHSYRYDELNIQCE